MRDRGPWNLLMTGITLRQRRPLLTCYDAKLGIKSLNAVYWVKSKPCWFRTWFYKPQAIQIPQGESWNLSRTFWIPNSVSLSRGGRSFLHITHHILLDIYNYFELRISQLSSFAVLVIRMISFGSGFAKTQLYITTSYHGGLQVTRSYLPSSHLF